MRSTIAQVAGGKKSHTSIVSFVLLMAAFWLAISPRPANAWKPRTHVYIANIIMADAQDGTVSIPPFGDFQVRPEALDAIRRAPDYFRAGAVGPDGFPDVFTGQMKIHPDRTEPWLTSLWQVAGSWVYRDADPVVKAQVWAFVFGFLTHAGADMWAHDWVNYYAGGVFPSVSDFVSGDPTVPGLIVARHLAIENTLDKQVSLSNSTIEIPKDFVLKYMVARQSAVYCGMNPIIEYFVKKYLEKEPHKDDTIDPLGIIPTYDACWYEDLALGLDRWVDANRNAMKEVVEQDKNIVSAVVDNVGPWAIVHVLDMAGAPSVTRYLGGAAVTVAQAVGAFMDWIGLSKPIEEVRDYFVDSALQLCLGMSQEELKNWFDGMVGPTLFPDNWNQIMQDIGTVPPEQGWDVTRSGATPRLSGSS